MLSAFVCARALCYVCVCGCCRQVCDHHSCSAPTDDEAKRFSYFFFIFVVVDIHFVDIRIKRWMSRQYTSACAVSTETQATSFSSRLSTLPGIQRHIGSIYLLQITIELTKRERVSMKHSELSSLVHCRVSNLGIYSTENCAKSHTVNWVEYGQKTPLVYLKKFEENKS